ncbi:MAG: FCD domain-containing protein [Eubacteriales bacterium]|nr:FCD domain-containing protein [Eubacteriales bacterium]
MYEFKNHFEIRKAIEIFENQILSEHLKPGTKLENWQEIPGLKTLKPKSIEKAIKMMEVLELIEIRDGEPYISENFSPMSMMNPASLAFMLHGGNSHQVYESRLVTECYAAYLAAERRTEDEVDILKTIIDRMASNRDSHADKDFHFIISKMTKNKLMYYQTMSMIKLTNSFIADSMNQFVEAYSLEVVHKVHCDIYEAIKNQRPQEAYNAMKKHFDLLEKFYQ